MQDGFSYCHSNSVFWEQLLELPVRQYHYGGRESSPNHTGDLQSLLHYAKSWSDEEPTLRKTSHIYKYRNRLIMLEWALKSHEHLGTSQSACQHKKLNLQVYWQTVSFSGYILPPFCQPLVEDHLGMACLFSWSLYYTSFSLIKWHLKVTGNWPFLMFMGSPWNYLIRILQ
jgi:hypothetical protein